MFEMLPDRPQRVEVEGWQEKCGHGQVGVDTLALGWRGYGGGCRAGRRIA